MVPTTSASTAVQCEVAATVTCSLCSNLYRDPRIMPGCQHTFCLRCLQKLPIEKKNLYWKINCPECNSVSKLNGPIEERNADNFKPNIIATNVVKSVKADRDGKGCKHYGERELCIHCNRKFCRNCRFIHMEEMKTTSLEIFDKCSKPDEERMKCAMPEKMVEIDRYIEAESANAEKQIEYVLTTVQSAFHEALESQARVLRDRLTVMKNEQSTALKAAVHLLDDKENFENLEESRKIVANESVLKMELPDISNFYMDVLERFRSASYLNEVLELEPSTLFTLELSQEVESFINSFESVNFGALKVNPKAELSKLPFTGTAIERPSTAASKELNEDDNDVVKVDNNAKRGFRGRKRLRILSDSEEVESSKESEMTSEESASSEEESDVESAEEEDDDEEAEEEEGDNGCMLMEVEEGSSDDDDDNGSHCSYASSEAIEVNGEQDEVVIDSVLEKTQRININSPNAIIALPNREAFGVVHQNKSFSVMSNLQIYFTFISIVFIVDSSGIRSSY